MDTTVHVWRTLQAYEPLSPTTTTALPPQIPIARTVLVLVAVGLWAFRLSYNWARGWTGLDHEDWRYVNMRKDITKGERRDVSRGFKWNHLIRFCRP